MGELKLKQMRKKYCLSLGMDSTIQRADEKPYGVNYRICPETTETQMNVRRCFAVNGSEAAPTATQPVLPDLSHFEVLKYFSHAVLLVYSTVQYSNQQALVQVFSNRPW